MLELVLLLLGLALAVSGGLLMRRISGRDDELRWRGFLILLVGFALVVWALVPRHD